VARIFLIDDHPAVRQGLKLLLSQESHTVCGEAGSRAETLAGIGPSGADMALLDLSLGEESGLELIARLRDLGILVLVYSMHEDAGTIEKAFSAGANGYVTKREMSDALLAAITNLREGGRHVSPRAALSLANRVISSPEENRGAVLSDREQQVLAMLGRGESSADIAAALVISVRTVETYYARLIDKLDLDGMKELRRHAIRTSGS
jgi:DNA-binding NarL/FixJ family response regulator